MAALENKTRPDLELFSGCSWSEWNNAVQYENVDSKVEICVSNHNKEVAKLKREDFGLFGFCPAKDNFYLVICEHCHHPVKPQAFSYHIEKFHREKTKSEFESIERKSLFSTLTSLGTCDNSFVGKSLVTTDFSEKKSMGYLNYDHSLKKFLARSHEKTSRESINTFSTSAALGKRSLLSKENEKLSKSSFNTKRPKLNTEISDSTPKRSSKFKQLSISQSCQEYGQSACINEDFNDHCLIKLDKKKKTYSFNLKHSSETSTIFNSSFSISDRIINGPVVVLEKSPISTLYSISNKRSSDAAKKQISKNFCKLNLSHQKSKSLEKSKISVNLFPDEHRNQTDMETKKKKIIHLKGRNNYDPNKHCGVKLEVDGLHCIRSLTCKIHARSLKRKVLGRSRPFDSLLVEHLQAKYKSKGKQECTAPPIDSTNAADSSCIGSKRDNAKHAKSLKIALSSMHPSNIPTHSIAKSNTPSVQLFSNGATVSLVDCWQDSMVFDDKNNLNKVNQTYSAQHPNPLMVCQFGIQKVSARCCVMNRRTKHQWNVLSSLGKSVSKNSFTSFIKDQQSSVQFSSILSANAPLISLMKKEKEAGLKPSLSTSASVVNSFHYPRINLEPRLSLQRLFSNKNLHSTQTNNLFLKKNSTSNVLSCQTKLNYSYINVRPSFTSPFVPMPLDKRLNEAAQPLLHSTQNTSDVKASPANYQNPGAKFSLQPHINMHCDSLRVLPHKIQSSMKKSRKQQFSVKKEFSNVNGLSANALSSHTNSTVILPPESGFSADNADACPVDSKPNFVEVSKNICNSNFKTIDTVNTHGVADEDISKPFDNSDVANTSSFTSEQINKLLSVTRDSAGSLIPCDVDRLTPKPRTSDRGAVSTNWTSEFISILAPEGDTKLSVIDSSNQNFSFPSREIFLKFSNDPKSIAEIGNT